MNTDNHSHKIGQYFIIFGFWMLLIALLAGILSAHIYLFPNFLKDLGGLMILRPIHVSTAVFWIISVAVGAVYCGLESCILSSINKKRGFIHLFLWIIGILGILYAYSQKDLGGREYWEFNPIWSIPLFLAWVLFLLNFIQKVRSLLNKPVYIWMWFTGIVFFLFTFLENYLWLFPYFREHLATDITIQWKANGSLVGAWNQLIYGTSFFLMGKISGDRKFAYKPIVFIMYFLGLFNLMFNWGHHIYPIPTESYIKYIGYTVSMTEWIFFIRIINSWKTTLKQIRKYHHIISYKFLIASEFWIFINMGQAILMSIPILNLYTHGTHITVAHAMGTTIGINTMILLAACIEFLTHPNWLQNYKKIINITFWFIQINLGIFWLSLNVAGIFKGIWQVNSLNPISFSKMMENLSPWFIIFTYSGILLSIGLIVMVLIIFIIHYTFQDRSGNLDGRKS